MERAKACRAIARLCEDGLKSKSIFKLNFSGREKANFV
jgi:hypothetical protein